MWQLHLGAVGVEETQANKDGRLLPHHKIIVTKIKLLLCRYVFWLFLPIWCFALTLLLSTDTHTQKGVTLPCEIHS